MFHSYEDIVEQFHALSLEQTATISKIYEILKENVRAWGEKTVLCFLYVVYLVVSFDFIQC